MYRMYSNPLIMQARRYVSGTDCYRQCCKLVKVI